MSSLWTACPCERELNLSHLAARCTTASPGPLRKDLNVLHESAPQHQTGDRTRRTLSESLRLEGSNSWSFCPVPSRRALWARGVSHRLGVGEGIQERKSSFWMWCQVLTIPLDYGGKQAAKKKVWNYRSLHISHVRFESLLDCCCVEGFCCFSCGTHKILAIEVLLVCGEDLNRPGQLGHSILENFSFHLWSLGKVSASVLLLGLFTLLLFDSWKFPALNSYSSQDSFPVFLTVPADNVTSKSICCCPNDWA